MHKWISITKPDDYAALSTVVPGQFSPDDVFPKLRDEFSPEIKGVLVEYPYIDKDYRSTYYGFYAKKGLRYDAFCARLHFFGEGVTLSNQLELSWQGGSGSRHELRYHYFGYMVLRPTEITPIGRTILSVWAKKDFSGALISTKHVVHVLGHRVEIDGFPYMQQHTDISVCAHAACWSILRHYSQRHGRYAEFLVHDITRMASDTDPGGLVPSRGLVMDQACKVFGRAGLFPDVYARDDFKENFYRILLAYVESGFPVFAALSQQQHAITIVGHGEPDRSVLTAAPEPQFTWDGINSYIVVDDNRMPYPLIDSLSSTPYRVSDIDAFIVPLPEKIFMPAEAVEKRVLYVLKNGFPKLDFSYLVNPVVRYFVTTSASFKNYVHTNRTQFPPDFCAALLELVLPQFVWFVEISSLTNWQGKSFNTLMLLDATASALDSEPFFVLHDQRRAFIFDRGLDRQKGYLDFAHHPITVMSEFKSNLTYKF